MIQLKQAVGVRVAAALCCASALAPAAQAQDFFSQLFGGIGRATRATRCIRMPFAGEAR
jgi:hypothetical protein